MKPKVCRCGYVFAILEFRDVGIWFEYEAYGRLVQICPQCQSEHAVIVASPRHEGQVIVRH